MKREEFEARKRTLRERSSQKTNVPKQLSSMGKDISGSPMLQALQAREELVRNGKLTTIIFIRDRNGKGQEVSGYIDYALRLKTENFEPYFEKVRVGNGEERSDDRIYTTIGQRLTRSLQRKKLMPKPSDLSYFNWETQTSTSNSTPNFQVIADNETGLLFKNKRDRKVINVDPNAKAPGDNSTRTEIKTSEYLQVVLYDHMTRRKS